MRELKEFDLLSKEIIAHGGVPFDPKNPDANKHLLEQRHLLEKKISEIENIENRQGDFDISFFKKTVAGHQYDDEDMNKTERGRHLAFAHIDEIDLSDWSVTEL